MMRAVFFGRESRLRSRLGPGGVGSGRADNRDLRQMLDRLFREARSAGVTHPDCGSRNLCQ